MIVSKLRLRILSASLFWGGAFFFLASSACTINRPPEQHFYDQHIQPILNNFCVGNTSPCHRIDPATGIALGNLDLSSFESVQKRRDVLRTYGSYPQPLLLLKALPEERADPLSTACFYQSEIRHTGGKPIAPTPTPTTSSSAGWTTAPTATAWRPRRARNMGMGDCNTAIPPSGRRRPQQPGLSAFVANGIQDKIRSSCAFGTCHSSPQSDFYMTCGDDDEQKQFNFSRAASFVVPMGVAVEQSEILLRPLAPAAAASATPAASSSGRATTTPGSRGRPGPRRCRRTRRSR